MTKIKKEIYTKRKHKKRQDSFWYVGDGDIAKFTKGDREVIVSVCGEIRAYFPDEEEQRVNEEAAYIAAIRNYFDKDLGKLDFSNTNWFAFSYKNGHMTDYEDIFGDVASDYDEALKEAKDCLDNDEFWNQFPTTVNNEDVYMNNQIEIKIGDIVELKCGLEGLVKASEKEGNFTVHLLNGDWFEYYQNRCCKGGECGSVFDYNFYDSSMDIRRVLTESIKTNSNTDKDFKVWDDLLSKLAWKFKPTESGDMFIEAEKVYSELKELFDLKYK